MKKLICVVIGFSILCSIVLGNSGNNTTYNNLVVNSILTSVKFNSSSVFGLAVGYKKIGIDFVYLGLKVGVRDKRFSIAGTLFFLTSVGDAIRMVSEGWKEGLYYLEGYLCLEWY